MSRLANDLDRLIDAARAIPYLEFGEDDLEAVNIIKQDILDRYNDGVNLMRSFIGKNDPFYPEEDEW